MPTQSVTLNSISPNPVLQPGGTATVTFSLTGNYTGTINLYATPVGGGTPVLVGSTTASQTSGNHTYTQAVTLNTAALDPNVDYNFVARDSSGTPTSNSILVDVNSIPVGVNACFAAGTKVATARGEVAVEDLRVGDLVVTPHSGAPLQPVIWLGHSRVNVARHPAPAKVAPVLIKAGALADGVPFRDLRVSPDHAMFLDGHLVPAKLLVNDSTIVQEAWCPEVTYWHVELPSHGLLVAEGAVSESYFDDGNRKNFDNYGVATLFKDFASERTNGRYATNACYPLMQHGGGLDRIRARISARIDAVIEAVQRVA
ncbi:Hint domain-containing protein [Neoroseomonas lacus]|uniref:Hedgehog/Intein (Hint) domain-containing protein n=1 Tax=Neoroseomonas lacus TaxID=287609 RepID=A0A917KQT6_9PROT|nr:Hint domain-containing protein [Neoroseomonas lacus]GGJ25593.1 hypothetical protein GCM10011320_36190 [Neoroseomonas lacus]